MNTGTGLRSARSGAVIGVQEMVVSVGGALPVSESGAVKRAVRPGQKVFPGPIPPLGCVYPGGIACLAHIPLFYPQMPPILTVKAAMRVSLA